MQRDVLSLLAHAEHPIAAPVADRRVEDLLARLDPPPGGRVLDLGCGQGAWLLALAARRPDLRLTGVDIAAPALEVGRRQAEQRHLTVTWVEADAATWSGEQQDAVLCVGAGHAFGGWEGTVAAVRRLLDPGGRALIGECFWEAPPSPQALAALDARPDEYPDLAGVVEVIERGGLEIDTAHVSTLEEWDDYEWSWTGSLVIWARTASSPEDRDEAITAAREHRTAWLSGYRGQLGFVSVVVAHATA